MRSLALTMRSLALTSVAALMLVPLAAAAGDKPMSAAEFDAYSQGKTLYYAIGGKPYGAEQYLPNHQVIWAFLGQECRRGHWYEDKGQICFSYENSGDGPQCWTFFPEAGGLRAHYMGPDSGGDLVEVRQSSEPLHCPGPAVGV
ncbi:hypothetical protein [Acidimangrovimonas pyrenivorans]|uniref:Uncharacterized protein n=1 Tax=Acidimangrovimonas pyrenivorans TaxID=2030798 RepID=A0ABV7AIB4_9RHOB